MTTSLPIGKHMLAQRLDDGWWVTNRRGQHLGAIVWHARWKQFEFVPSPRSGFTWDCLRAMSEFLVDLNKKPPEATAGVAR